MRHLAILSFCIFSFSKLNSQNWNVSYQRSKSFIENKGQFAGYTGQYWMENAPFAMDQGPARVFFTKSGVTFQYIDETLKVKKPKTKEERAQIYGSFKTVQEWREHELKARSRNFNREKIEMEWLGANPNVRIVPVLKTSDHHSYCYYDQAGKWQNMNFIKGYEKIIYENLYPGIDVEYVGHQENGFKYTIIVHPGADPSVVKMKYSNAVSLSPEMNIHVMTKFGPIIDHKPVTFYQNNKNHIIQSQFKLLDSNTVQFELGNYDKTKTILIDPWTANPAFNTNWDCIWEVEKDGAGNVYIIGGTMPLQLIKYNNAGAVQWTFNTPYDTTAWLGTFATDNAGNSYVTNGSTASIIKVNTSGTQVWNNPNPGGLFLSTEFWSISFNSDQTKLVIGGTGGSVPPLPYIYDVDVASGNMSASVQVTSGGLIPTQEVRSITACGNGKYYWLTHDSIGYITQNFGLCSSPAFYKTTNGINFGYKCEDWRYNNTGIMALRSDKNFVYVHKGNQLQKRSLADASIIGTVAIPGGGFTSGFGGNSVQNSGIDIDTCGNIYVGAKGQIVKFSSALVQLQTIAITANHNVYDLHVTSNGDIVYCASSGTSSNNSRTGVVGLVSFGACNPLTFINCDATICPVTNKCLNDPAFTLTAATPGGTWSGPGVNPATGLFTPSVAGVGNHTIIYTLPCGLDSVKITVSPCVSMEECLESNGTLTVSNGVAPYTWQYWTAPVVTNITNSATCTSCGGTWFFGTCLVGGLPSTSCTTPGFWTTFATGTNSGTLPASFPVQPIRVKDNVGTIDSIPNLTGILPCSSCNPPTVPAVSICSNNSATVNVNPIVAGNTYLWYTVATGGTSINTGISYTTPILTANTTYYVEAVIAGCTSTRTAITVTVTNPTTPTFTQVAAICSGGTFTLPTTSNNSITGTWSPAINNTTTTTYTFTPTAGQCATTQTMTVTVNSAITPTFTQVAAICSGGTFTLPTTSNNSITGTWSPAINNTATTTYTFTPTAGQCATTQTMTVTVNNPITPTFTQVAAICSGGTFTLPTTSNNSITGTWSPAINNTATTTYTFTPSAGQCATTQTMTVTVNSAITPTFTQVAAICSGGTFTLPTTSNNSITGTWSPAINNTATTTYTFTPTAGQCATTQTMTVTVNSAIISTFTQVAAICSGGTFTLPTTSNNSITGTWSPAINNTATTTYTFTPSAGQCATTQTMTVTVNAIPAAPIVDDIVVCTNTSGTLTVTNQVVGVNYDWYSQAIGGTSIFTGVSFTTPNISTNTTYYVEAVSNGCTSTRSAVNVTVTSSPTATLSGLNSTYCDTDALVNLGGSPSGGSFSGPGVSGSTFDPGLAGVGGPYEIIYTVTSSCGTAADTVLVTVNAAPSVTLSGLNPTYCVGDAVANLTGLPAGGTFSGTGVVGSTFDPGFAGVGGPYNVIYTVVAACGSVSDTLTVTVLPNPTSDISGLNATYCVNEAAVVISGLPSGGTFSGPGVVGNTFDPSIAGVGGPYEIIYSVTNTCGTANDTLIVSVNPLPTASNDNLATSYCVGDPSITMIGTPVGGTFSGPGVTGNVFDPAAAGVGGPYPVVYSVTDACGTATDTVFVNITSSPVGSISGLPDTICVNALAVTLTGSPNGGTFSGNGMSGNSFDPAAAGLGQHIIVYSGTGSCGAYSAQDTVEVISTPIVSINPLQDTVCQNASSLTLSANISGGTFSGNGVSGTSFNPASAGLGNQMVYYTYNHVCGTVVDSQLIVVVNNPTIDITTPNDTLCSSDLPLTLNAIPLGGVFSGNGVTSNTFDPNLAGIGLHTVYYTFNAACVNIIDSILIKVNTPTLSIADVNICAGDTIQINPVTNIVNPIVSWSGAPISSSTDITPLVNPAVSTTYYLTLTDSNGCSVTDSVLVQVTPFSLANFIALPDSGVYPLTVQVSDSSIANTWNWNFGNGVQDTGRTPQAVVYEDEGQYQITLITDINGCPDTLIKTITVKEPDYYIHIPNVFTPNKDGLNDEHIVVAAGWVTYEFSIFDRWGHMMFTADDPSKHWDGKYKGKECPESVYVYMFKGTSTKGRFLNKAGTITLLR